MSFGINKTSAAASTQQVGAKARAAASDAEASVGYEGDSLKLAGRAKAQAQELKTMSKDEAAKAKSLGGKLVVGGLVGSTMSYLAAGALASVAGTTLLPIALVGGFAGLALWGASKFAKGMAADWQRTMEDRLRGLDSH